MVLLLAVMAALAIGAGVLGYRLIMRRRSGLGIALALVPTLLGALLVVMAQGAQGFDGVGYAAIASVCFMPLAFGLWLGLLAGGVRRWWVERTETPR